MGMNLNKYYKGTFKKDFTILSKIFDSGVYPINWSKCMIIPVHKKVTFLMLKTIGV